MIIIPSRGRPHSLARFFASSKPTERGVVLLDEDDSGQYQQHLALPPNWEVLIGPRAGYTELVNRAFRRYPDEPWYANLGDDCLCSPPGWDTRLAALAGSDGVAYGNDMINGQRACCFPFLGGDLARRIGWLAYPAFSHLYSDTVWREIGTSLGVLRYCPDIVTEHLHWTTGKQPYDQTARERRTAGDRETYEHLVAGGFAEILARCKS